MKQGGNSWNGSTRSKKGVVTRSNCKICGRSYKMEWAKDNHEKQCGDQTHG